MHFEANIAFWHFVNKPSWHKELHVQQGKHTHTPNLHSSLLVSGFMHANFTVFCGISNFKLFSVPNNFKLTISMHP